jgi:hypothetical protein
MPNVAHKIAPRSPRTEVLFPLARLYSPYKLVEFKTALVEGLTVDNAVLRGDVEDMEALDKDGSPFTEAMGIRPTCHEPHPHKTQTIKLSNHTPQTINSKAKGLKHALAILNREAETLRPRPHTSNTRNPRPYSPNAGPLSCARMFSRSPILQNPTALPAK